MTITKSDFNLLGQEIPPTLPVKLFVYCDEIKKEKNAKGENWFYIGMLLIPEDKKVLALQKMMDARDSINYQRELHFRNLTNYSYANHFNEKTCLASKWISLLLNDKKEKLFYFNVLGINSDNLEWKYFGAKKRELFTNAYNRFFRTLLKSSLNNFFPKQEVIILQIFHDEDTALKNHLYFDWHSIKRISNELVRVKFETDQIQFIDSNHILEQNYPKDSHFIQMIDLILGSLRQTFDCTCKKDGCNEIAKLFSEMLLKMKEAPTNPNSHFGYYRKYSFSFFPLKKSNLQDYVENKIENQFFNSRRLLLFNDQLELFN